MRVEILLKQKLNLNGLVKETEKFVSSEKMLPILGIFVVLCHISGWDLAGFTVLWAVAVFVFLSDANIRGSIPSLLFAPYVISNQNGVAVPRMPLNPNFFLSHAGYLVFLIATLVLCAAYGIWKRREKLRLRLTFGMVSVAAISGSFLLGGIFSADYSPVTLGVGAVFAVYFMLFFLFFSFIAPTVSFEYIACVVLTASLCVLFQLFHLFFIDGVLTSGLTKNAIALGWGISNNIAPMIALGIPFSAYYMAVHEKPWVAMVCFFIFVAQTAGVILCLSRATLLVVVPFVVGVPVFALIKAKGRAKVCLLITVLASLAVITIFVLTRMEMVLETLKFYLEVGFSDRGRIALYEEALQIFLKYPLFGAGAAYRLADWAHWDMLVYMVHNTVLQFMLWSGITGLLAILLHILFLGKLLFLRPNLKRFVLLLAAGLLFLHSMLDWAWFYPFTLLYYMLFVAAAEKLVRGGIYGS